MSLSTSAALSTLSFVLFDIGVDEEELVDQIVEAVSGMTSNIVGLADLAMMPPEEMAGGLYASIMRISKGPVATVGWSLLTLFLMIELANIFKRQEARGIDSIYFIAVIFLKVGIAKMLMENIDKIVGMAFAITQSIGSPIHDILVDMKSGATEELTAALTEAVKDSSVFWRTIMGMLVVIFQLFDWLMNGLCYIVIYLRFIEIFIFAAIGPIPVATWPSKEYSSVFRNWIKRIIGLALHAVLIILCLWFYMKVIESGFSLKLVGAGDNETMAGWLVSFAENGHWVTGVLGFLVSILSAKIMLIISLFQTSGWAKSLAGAA